MATRVLNLTGHPVTIVHTSGVRQSFPPVDLVVNLRCDNKLDGGIEVDADLSDDPFPVVRQRRRLTATLPPPAEGTVYIVSHVVGEFARRADLVWPASMMRSKRTGELLGCRAFARCDRADAGGEEDGLPDGSISEYV